MLHRLGVSKCGVMQQLEEAAGTKQETDVRRANDRAPARAATRRLHNLHFSYTTFDKDILESACFISALRVV